MGRAKELFYLYCQYITMDTKYLCYTEILMDEMLHRIPALKETEIRQIVNGPESFTPDGSPLLGEVPEVCYLIWL